MARATFKMQGGKRSWVVSPGDIKDYTLHLVTYGTTGGKYLPGDRLLSWADIPEDKLSPAAQAGKLGFLPGRGLWPVVRLWLRTAGLEEKVFILCVFQAMWPEPMAWLIAQSCDETGKLMD